MSALGTPLLLGEEATGYQISRSVRLRSSASAYFNRTPASASDRQKWTWSGWVKIGDIANGSTLVLLSSGDGTTSNYCRIEIVTNQIQFINVVGASSAGAAQTTAVYRDPSAWYHVVVAVDTTQATAANRAILYVNGVSVGWTFSTNVTQNSNTWINSANAHYLAGRQSYSAANYFDGYLTEVNFIDGQALTPSSFGETDAVTGVWKPKKYAGTYGTNGFYLNFSDNSAATAAAIGKDSSGNGNNWTPNNISVTAGVTYDSMLDVPTMYADGGNGRGNYCVINPLDTQNASSVAQGNQYISFSAVNYGHSRATQPAPDGSYWEVVAGGTNYLTLGIANSTAFSSFNWAGCWAIYQSDGKVYNSAAAITGVLATFTTNDVIGFAVKGNKLYIAKNGTWLNSGDPVAGTGSVASSLPSEVFPYIGNGGGAAGTPSAYFNAGQRPFAYTPPTGFKALNTQNLPDATIKKGNAYFDVTTYTGNASTQSIVNSGAMQPDFVWMKSRSAATGHLLQDAVRGTSKYLQSNSTNAEGTAANVLTSFNSDGFSIGNDTGINTNAATYAAWQWKESASAGFDIVTWTGDGTSSRNINHSLGVAPKMIISKSRTLGAGDAGYWDVYHASLAAQNTLFLHTTGAAVSAPTIWPSAPTSTYFTVGSGSGVNVSGSTMVAYLFSEVAGFSKFGSYAGNSAADGPFVYCGFRPRWVMIKKYDGTAADWIIFDSSRRAYNVMGEYLFPNSSAAEASASLIDFTSNGFKLRANDGTTNQSPSNYIYAAFAENPFKNSLAR